MPVPQALTIVAALLGALAAWAGVTVTGVTSLWNKLDRRFDDLEARQNQRFDELKAEMQEGRAEVRALRDALLSVNT